MSFAFINAPVLGADLLEIPILSVYPTHEATLFIASMFSRSVFLVTFSSGSVHIRRRSRGYDRQIAFGCMKAMARFTTHRCGNF
jgi:hypothetical protein